MRCDYAACQRTATQKAGPWLFCADHFEADKSEAVGADAPPPPKPPAPIYCGTVAGYREHLADGEDPCGLCVKANNCAIRSKRKRDKKKAAAAAHTDSATPADVCRVDGDLGTACWTGGYGEVPKVQQAPITSGLASRWVAA